MSWAWEHAAAQGAYAAASHHQSALHTALFQVLALLVANERPAGQIRPIHRKWKQGESACSSRKVAVCQATPRMPLLAPLFCFFLLLFQVTRSDYFYSIPHPPLTVLCRDNIWSPNGAQWGGITVRLSAPCHAPPFAFQHGGPCCDELTMLTGCCPAHYSSAGPPSNYASKVFYRQHRLGNAGRDGHPACP